MEGKGEKEKYTHLNGEFQGIAQRDKKAFLSEQCKEIEETIEWERHAKKQNGCPGSPYK